MRRDGASECVRIAADEAYSDINTQKVRILTRMLWRHGRDKPRLHISYARRARSHCIRRPGLKDLWRESSGQLKDERKLARKHGASDLSTVDEHSIDRTKTKFKSMPPQQLELKYSTALTALCKWVKK